ncbi:Uncharacterised protein [Escherichia coli]|uniref:Uncharacterized protein n=1 Tax=Escherichia coli TaxID=562 RepID=A0A377E886_ECOLX|nr:Uncharacterised protein [Escherichia coli]
MNIKQPQYTFSALALAVVVGLSGPALAQSAAGSSPGAAAPSAASKAAQPQVDDKAARKPIKSVPSSLKTPSRRSPRPRSFDPP